MRDRPGPMPAPAAEAAAPQPGAPFVLRAPRTGREVRFPTRMLLAPMDGITDPVFRTLVAALGGVGGTVTEFLRLTTGPFSAAVLRRELGPPTPGVPRGVQLMTPGPEHVAATAARAEAAGADWVDLNFGCPVPRVVGKCAGSALLADPGRLEAVVAAAVEGTDLPVTAKIRAGIDDDGRLEEILDAAATGGASMIALHARLRRHSYAEPARWDWIARAAARLRGGHPGVLLAGNGGIENATGPARMLRATGCDVVMVGRAAFRDPFLFRVAAGGRAAGAGEAAAFAVDYLAGVRGGGGGLGRARQFVRHYAAGDLFGGEEGARTRSHLLREGTAAEIEAYFRPLFA